MSANRSTQILHTGPLKVYTFSCFLSLSLSFWFSCPVRYKQSESCSCCDTVLVLPVTASFRKLSQSWDTYKEITMAMQRHLKGHMI